jgi:hypothetical protein
MCQLQQDLQPDILNAGRESLFSGCLRVRSPDFVPSPLPENVMYVMGSYESYYMKPLASILTALQHAVLCHARSACLPSFSFRPHRQLCLTRYAVVPHVTYYTNTSYAMTQAATIQNHAFTLSLPAHGTDLLAMNRQS